MKNFFRPALFLFLVESLLIIPWLAYSSVLSDKKDCSRFLTGHSMPHSIKDEIKFKWVGSLKDQVKIGDRIEKGTSDTIAFFNSHLFKILEPIQIEAGSLPAFRTGYDFDRKVVQYPNLRNIKGLGSESADVIRHETVHALLCAKRPEICTKEFLKNPEATVLHEALADFIAYKMSPDGFFGEEYYLDKPYVRSYVSDFNYSLVAGAHNKASALVTFLITRDFSVEDMKVFFAQDDFSISALLSAKPEAKTMFSSMQKAEINFTSVNYPLSSLHRYRMQAGKPLILEFVPNIEVKTEFRGLTVRILDENFLPVPDLKIAASGDGNHIRIEISSSSPVFKKLLACYYDGEKLIGFQPFYIEAELEKSVVK